LVEIKTTTLTLDLETEVMTSGPWLKTNSKTFRNWTWDHKTACTTAVSRDAPIRHWPIIGRPI